MSITACLSFEGREQASHASTDRREKTALTADPTSSQDEIVLVKYASLPRSDGPLRAVQLHRGRPVGLRHHRRGGARMIVANLGGRFERPGRRIPGNPVATFQAKFVAL